MRNSYRNWVFAVVMLLHPLVYAVPVTSVLDENRILLFDDYNLTNNTPKTWVHDGGAALGFGTTVQGLLAGTNHYHRTGWVFVNCRMGQRNAFYYVPPQMATNYTPPTATTNYSANLMNTLTAAIYSPILTNGIGTLYFEAVNTAPQNAGPAELTVEIATNMIGGAALFGNMTNVNVDWKSVCVTNLNVASADNFARMIEKLDVRQPVALRIKRSSTVVGAVVDNHFACVDNIRVSPPAPILVFGNINAVADSSGTFVECAVSNVPGTLTPTDHTTRDVQLCYRWFSASVTQQWNTVAMGYEPATGTGGDGEKWKATFAFVPGMMIEYYFTYANPIYQSPDYTEKGYVYPIEKDIRRYPAKHTIGRGRNMVLLW